MIASRGSPGAASSPAEAFALTDLPTLPFTISVAVDDVSVPLQFGFADATASGSFHLTTDISVTLNDPDGNGRLTASEATGHHEEGISDVRAVPFPEVLAMVANGTITDGETVAALMYAAIHLGRVR